ncbi:MAG: sensor histidine kinase [Desulfobacca sp.]|uniref:sensor histidine kinase n=1 Tax=Desulfobacca sp. TaxID=2067990 RepID=UPI00404B6864
MSLDLLSRRPNLSLRLTLWFFLILALASLAVLGIACYLLTTSLRQQDQDSILVALREYQTQYQAGKLMALRNTLKFERAAGKPDIFFVRLAGPRNQTLFLHLPEQWADFDVQQLERMDPVPTWLRLQAAGEDDVLEIATVRLPDNFFLQVGKDTGGREELLEHFQRLALSAVIPLLLLGLLGGKFLAGRALRPIRQLLQTVQTITATGTMTARAPLPPGGDELAELARLFNRMLDRISALMDGMRQTLDYVAHDLRTPLTRLRGIAESALQTQQEPEGYREALADCLEETERLANFLNTLLDIAEAEAGTLPLHLASVAVAPLLTDLVDLYRYVAEDKQIHLTAEYPADLWVTADAGRLRQVLANILDNAVKYTPPGGRITVMAAAAGPWRRLTIVDTGMGIPSAELPRIWDRLYRGEASRSQRGLGLGLSLVRAIITAHGGQVKVTSQLGQGSRFDIYLPA